MKDRLEENKKIFGHELQRLLYKLGHEDLDELEFIRRWLMQTYVTAVELYPTAKQNRWIFKGWEVKTE